jgi:TM2 domain-containing membrane protein YozV
MTNTVNNTVKIAVHREKQAFLVNPPVEIFLDEVKKAEVRNNETVFIEAEQGQHNLSFKYSFRRAFINADFTQDANVNIRFNRGSGEIEAKLFGASEVPRAYDWENQPRDEKMVYPDKRKTSPSTAMLLSILLVGLGQMVNGQGIKGLLMLVVALVLGILTQGIAGILIWIISGIDAYMCVSKLNQGQPIGRFSFF